MENASDYLMLRLLLICMRWNKKVCYKVSDNNEGKYEKSFEIGIANYSWYNGSFFGEHYAK